MDNVNTIEVQVVDDTDERIERSDIMPIVKRRYQTAAEIEIKIAQWFNYRTHLIVPNVCWGASLHECDLLILTKAGYALEVEIKVSKGDIIRDSKKLHQHRSEKIKRLFFAIPKKLEKHIGLIPEHAGVITVDETGYCRLIRNAKPNRAAKKWGDKDRFNIARLGAMRIWNLKEKLCQQKLGGNGI
jgi:hypothetical protein